MGVVCDTAALTTRRARAVQIEPTIGLGVVAILVLPFVLVALRLQPPPEVRPDS